MTLLSRVTSCPHEPAVPQETPECGGKEICAQSSVLDSRVGLRSFVSQAMISNDCGVINRWCMKQVGRQKRDRDAQIFGRSVLCFSPSHKNKATSTL